MGKMMDLDTTQIQRGDVVHVHGMRVLMDVDPIITEPAGRVVERRCYAWVGLVLDPEEVADTIPRSWLYRDGIGQTRQEPRWNVQGNDLARWNIERP